MLNSLPDNESGQKRAMAQGHCWPGHHWLWFMMPTPKTSQLCRILTYWYMHQGANLTCQIFINIGLFSSFHGIISYGPYHMVHFIWSIWYHGPYGYRNSSEFSSDVCMNRNALRIPLKSNPYWNELGAICDYQGDEINVRRSLF